MTQTSPRAIRRRVAFVKRALPVLLLVVGALVSPTAGGIAWADGSQDPPALISVGDAKSADLMAQVAAYNESVVAQQAVEQDLVAEKAALGAMVARVNAALNADDAAGNATDEQFAELNSEIQAYNDAGPPGDPAEAAELDARGQELAAQQAQNNAKVDTDNADRDRGLAAVAAHNEKATDYENTNQQLTARRATLMVQILSEEEAAELPVIATPTTVDSLRGMDPPQPGQEYPAEGGDNSDPAATLPSCTSNSSCPSWKSDFDGLANGKQVGSVKVAPSTADLRALFDEWTAGAQQLPARGPKIPDVFKLADGTVIQWRMTSASGGETIDVFPPGGKPLKVHLNDGS